MPDRYEPTLLEDRTFNLTGTASGEALSSVIQSATLAELATLRVGENKDLGGVRFERME